MLRIGWLSHHTFGALFRLQAELAQRTASLDAAEARLRAEIAEHQATEAALRHVQKMEAIGQITGGIAHDFNNMLTAIGGNLQLIHDAAGADGPIRRYVTAAERAADRGAKLVASMLGFVRPAGAARRDRADERPAAGFPAAAAPGRGAMPAGNKAGRRPAGLHGRGGAVPIGDTQLGDQRPRREPCRRLGDSGTEVAAPGPAEFPPELTAEPGWFVSVSVTDTGSGMTEDVRARAFEPFFTTKPPGKGSGLGLAQVFSFARAAGGL